MNTLVVYDSQFGNTERIAQVMAGALRAYGKVQVVRVGQARPEELQKVDLLLLGSPTQGFRPTPAMQAFLASLTIQQLSGMEIACFDTRFRGGLWKSSAAPRMIKQLRAMGVESIAQPESFFVKSMKKEGPLLPGETERAVNWALKVHQRYDALRLRTAAR